MLEAKLSAGVRKLTQDEKNLMLGLYDSRLQDGMAQLKKMIGIKAQTSTSPKMRKRAEN